MEDLQIKTAPFKSLERVHDSYAFRLICSVVNYIGCFIWVSSVMYNANPFIIAGAVRVPLMLTYLCTLQ